MEHNLQRYHKQEDFFFKSSVIIYVTHFFLCLYLQLKTDDFNEESSSNLFYSCPLRN